MKIRCLKSALAGLAVFSLASNALAWHSVLGSTHEKISKKAYKLLDKNIYPDLNRASEEIKDGSSSEDGHENNHTGGGKMKDWWDGGDGRSTLYGGVIPNYTGFTFKEAYYNIGRMVHLTQDQAVPAHAARIPHGMSAGHLDGMEKYSQYNAVFDAIPAVDNSRQPYDYYQELQNNTRDHLPGWVHPGTRQPYWELTANAPERGQDLTMYPAGGYGGGNDGYSVRVITRDPSSEGGQAGYNELISHSPEISRDRLAIAAGYTKAMIEAASKHLPPLVAELELSSNVLAPGQKMNISFLVLENRTRKVAYEVTASGSGSAGRIIASGIAVLGGPAIGEYLMKGKVNISWDGLLGGKPPEEGTYTLEVYLTDEDGNSVPGRVNTDGIPENDTKAVFSVVNTALKTPAPLSF
jgi:hypothetical protein